MKSYSRDQSAAGFLDQLTDCFWHDPQYNSHDALAQFVRVVRDREND